MIHYLVPSRGRPQNAARLLMAFQATCISDTALTFCVDDDDPTLAEYKDIVESARYVNAGITVGERIRMGPTLNKNAVKVARAYPNDIVGFMGDDHLPRTAGWDTTLQYELDEMKVGIWYGNDTIQRGAIPTAVAMTANIINELGYMVLPGLIHMYIDNFWKALGDGSQTLRYRDDVIIEHIHPLAGKTAWDAGYIEVNDGKIYEHDGLLFQAYVQSQRYVDDVNKIIKLKENHATTT
jgi:hypothetical protein